MTIRTRVLRAVVIVVAVWTALHLVLAHSLGFSSWKLGGIGMFTDPHPGLTHVGVVLLPDRVANAPTTPVQIEQLPFPWWGAHAGGDSLVQAVRVLDDGSAVAVPLAARAGFSSHSYSGLTGALTHVLRSAQTLRRASDLRALVDVANGAAGSNASRAVVIVSHARLRVGDGTLYIQSCAYALHGDVVERAGCSDSDRGGAAALDAVLSQSQGGSG